MNYELLGLTWVLRSLSYGLLGLMCELAIFKCTFVEINRNMPPPKEDNRGRNRLRQRGQKKSPLTLIVRGPNFMLISNNYKLLQQHHFAHGVV